MLEILIVLTIAIIVSVFISLPFFRKNEFDQPHSEEDSHQVQETMIKRLNVLNNEKESIYNALKDIEFDYEIGKLSKNDFEELSLSYKSKAISILKEIDEISNEIKFKEDYKPESEKGSGEDGSMEREILQIRNSNKTLEPFIKCLNCGKERNPDDLFCSKCGAKLSAEKSKDEIL